MLRWSHDNSTICTHVLSNLSPFISCKLRIILHISRDDLRQDIGLERDLGRSIKQFNLQAKEWGHWAQTAMTMKVYDKVMGSMKFGARAVEEIEDQLWGGEPPAENGAKLITLWAFYNVLTWYITHRIASLNHRVEVEKSINDRFLLREGKWR